MLDQTVPVPYPITAAELAEANWLPSYLQGEYAGVDKETRIRRHPSFRAYYGAEGEEPSDGQIDLKGVSDIRIGFKTYSYGGK